MAVVVGTNSWVTIVEADTYFNNHIDGTKWSGLANDAEKEKYLVTAFNWLLYDGNYELVPTTTATSVKYAQMEAALFLITNYDEFHKREALIASGVTEFTYSKWKEKLGAVNKPAIVDDMLNKGGYVGGTYFVEISVDYNG